MFSYDNVYYNRDADTFYEIGEIFDDYICEIQKRRDDQGFDGGWAVRSFYDYVRFVYEKNDLLTIPEAIGIMRGDIRDLLNEYWFMCKQNGCDPNTYDGVQLYHINGYAAAVDSKLEFIKRFERKQNECG